MYNKIQVYLTKIREGKPVARRRRKAIGTHGVSQLQQSFFRTKCAVYADMRLPFGNGSYKGNRIGRRDFGTVYGYVQLIWLRRPENPDPVF